MPKGTVPTIAVVDPDGITCKLLREICLAGAWNVVGCTQDIQHGLAILSRTKPDYLITDYKFDGPYTGLDLIAQAKIILPGLVAILLTGWDINNIAAHVGMHPPDRILRKPVPPHMLMDLLDGIHEKMDPIRIQAV